MNSEVKSAIRARARAAAMLLPLAALGALVVSLPPPAAARQTPPHGLIQSRQRSSPVAEEPVAGAEVQSGADAQPVPVEPAQEEEAPASSRPPDLYQAAALLNGVIDEADELRHDTRGKEKPHDGSR